jgi:hypothetical protein
MSNESKLRPCPFCGSEDVMDQQWEYNGHSGPGCLKCGGSAHTVEQWNTRLNIPAGGRFERAMQAWLEGLEQGQIINERHAIATVAAHKTQARCDERRDLLHTARSQAIQQAAHECEDDETYRARWPEIHQTYDKAFAETELAQRAAFDHVHSLCLEANRQHLDTVRAVVAILKGEA